MNNMVCQVWYVMVSEFASTCLVDIFYGTYVRCWRTWNKVFLGWWCSWLVVGGEDSCLANQCRAWFAATQESVAALKSMDEVYRRVQKRVGSREGYVG